MEDKENPGVGEVDQEKPVEYSFGIGSFRPKCLQVFMNAKFFTFLLCCNTFVEGALVSGFTSVVLSPLERRYQLTSTQTGLIPSVFDMAVVVSVIFVSYFGGKGHKPRWLGVGLLIQGLGALIFALPQFVFGSYAVGPRVNNRLESCADGVDFSPLCEVTDKNQYSLIFFYIGNIFVGVAAAPLFTVAPSYIDDIVYPKYVSIHLGLFFMLAIFGPALGFGLGSAFLSVYVDFWEETTLEPSDPGWVGAWWLCFLFVTALSWLLAIPFLMFPRLLPDSQLVKAEREKEMAQKYSAKDAGESKGFLAKFGLFPGHVIQIVTTPSWILITIAVCFGAFVVEGLVPFAPKIFEAQFSLPASLASLAAGGSAIGTGSLGALVGAIIIHRFKGRHVAVVNWVVSLIAIPSMLVFLVRCPTLQLAGVNVAFPDGSLLSRPYGPTNSSCNLNCNCSSSIFEPVCGSDNLTYFSPCTAGCDKAFIDNDPQRPIFENCSCVVANLVSSLNLSTSDLTQEAILMNGTATDGVCDNGCKNLTLFLGLLLVMVFLLFILEVPNIVVTMRCVADEQRALALGVQSFFFRILGSIPGPVVFGVMFDAACIYFRFDVPCMSRGNCWVYDNYQLSWSILTVSLAGVALYFSFSFLAWVAYPKQTASDIEAKVHLEFTNSKVELEKTNN